MFVTLFAALAPFLEMSASFQIIVCGAGIGGLCAAIGLARKGHDVLVLESHHELSEVGSGIHVPNNATRVLKAWGVLDRLRPTAVAGTDFVMHRYADSSVLFRRHVQRNDDPDATPLVFSGRAKPCHGLSRGKSYGVLTRLAATGLCIVTIINAPFTKQPWRPVQRFALVPR